MGIPVFLARKLYRRGSLRETANGRFAFTLQNPLGKATIVGPPHFTINGIRYDAGAYEVSGGVDPRTFSPDRPFEFPKGGRLDIHFAGHLLRGANRIHLVAETREFGTIDMLIEDQEADYCELPGAGEEE